MKADEIRTFIVQNEICAVQIHVEGGKGYAKIAQWKESDPEECGDKVLKFVESWGEFGKLRLVWGTDGNGQPLPKFVNVRCKTFDGVEAAKGGENSDTGRSSTTSDTRPRTGGGQGGGVSQDQYERLHLFYQAEMEKALQFRLDAATQACDAMYKRAEADVMLQQAKAAQAAAEGSAITDLVAMVGPFVPDIAGFLISKYG